MEEHNETYYIEHNDKEIEVEVLWHVTSYSERYEVGDGSVTRNEADYVIYEVTNLGTDDIWRPSEREANFGWELAFQEADVNGDIQCYID